MMNSAPSTTLVLGLGVAGRAALSSLARRGIDVIAVDDDPGEEALALVDRLGVELLVAPGPSDWPAILAVVDEVVMAPGIRDTHPCHGAARSAGVPIVDESDLAARWDDRPRCAVTGTNGKTTVVTLVVDMLERSGIRALPAGNTDTPLVAAIDDSEAEVFVVEASSFRLAHAASFSASPAAWLNFAPDHLDVHSDQASYQNAKARIFEGIADPSDAVANAADPVVVARAPVGATFFGTPNAPCRVDGKMLVVDERPIVAIGDLPRALPHDLANALAAIALAIRSGADPDSCRASLVQFSGLDHRITFVAEVAGVRYVDDSKATTPHATLTAMSGLPGAVLIAGGRNKGLSLMSLAAARPRAVVAIGESADEIVAAFAGQCPVEVADSMESAVVAAGRFASGRGSVLLSPACSSFDWYDSYVERGLDFQRIVASLDG
ncbi:MAG TPA: UDP-N-acetylmuramoyl-L-alanine--D-glutamate ligase [Acidimicrobiaceae bacterium]|nr:UDP-N-acetylmuramoyl-L-alanine--D-glutamate ligase [Acidimicrobiaceae bacterium]